MKHYALLALSLCCFVALNAQTPEQYSRVEINLGSRSMSDLAKLGIETDHGLSAAGKWFLTEISASDLQRIQNAGFDTKILIDDLQKDYLDQLQHPKSIERGGNCTQTATDYPTPENYTYGSMGGYHTLNEMMDVIDDMHAKFPQLITARKIVSDTIQTWEGRSLFYVKISDNPDVDEAEPQVLYTALHHAREPNSASQLLFYMWYLLENYDNDPVIKYIVDHEELYFIPCVNPDGYVYNETTNPQGGGYWRKNRRDNSDGSYGVDLNRNYGYFWGNDDSGSSPNPMSDTYRGPEAFSEPESRSVRDFGRAHHFVFALNYHTFGNLLIYPWAYSNQLAEPALATFGKIFSRENHFKTGTSIETVGYNVNGSSDDWLYSEGDTKSYTPEVGTTGFWPQPNEIDPLNRNNMWQNLSMALCALRYGEIQDKSPQYFSTLSPKIQVELTRFGYEDGPLNVSIWPLTSNIVSATPLAHIWDLQQFETKLLDFDITLQPSIQVGEEFTLVVYYSNGFYTKSDTLHKFYGGKTIGLYTEDGNNLNEWTGSWSQTDSTFVSPPYSITDSPNGHYAPNTSTNFRLANPGVVIPAGAKQPQLRFWAKWDIETGYDFVQVRAIGATNEALCGRYTRPGSNGAQPQGEPVFDGKQTEWVEECMDLSDFIDQEVDIRFILGADNGVEGDGFYFDDLRVEYIDPTLLNTVSIPLLQFRLYQNEPNPADKTTRIQWAPAPGISGASKILIFNNLGEKVFEKDLQLSGQRELQVDTQTFPAGLYTYYLQTPAGPSQPMKMTVLH